MGLDARLRAFAAVARQRSFSLAAAELFVSQPAVSKHIAALEAELQARLVERGGRGASLTHAGRVLADYVLRADALLTNGGRAVRALAGDESGTLAIAASGVPGEYVLPAPLAAFHARCPAVDIAFELTTSAGALELLRLHSVEVAVVGGLDVPRELAAEALLEDVVVLIGHASLASKRMSPRELSGSTWITREEGSSTRAAVEAARWQIGIRPERTLELPSWEAVKGAVRAGAGIAAISRYALEGERGLAELDVPRWRLRRTIAAVTARDVPLTPPAERFLELLRAELPRRARSAARRSRAPAASRSASTRARRARR